MVPIPHDVKGEAIHAYVTLNVGVEESSELTEALIKYLRKVVGPIATPESVQFTTALPKTRSGKIMRGLLRRIACGQSEDLGDTTTLANPSAVWELVEFRGA